MSNYAIINIRTRNTLAAVREIQKENIREKKYDDIDKQKESLNRYDDFKDFQEMYNEAMRNDYYTKPDKYGRKHKEPKIKCIDLMTTFSPEMKDKINIDEWYKAQKEYVEKRFKGCPYSVVLHLDQTTPHCHIQILPITPEGKINKSYFIKTKKDFVELQTDYADNMKCFELRRGNYRTKIDNHHMTEEQQSKYEEAMERVENIEEQQSLEQQFIDHQKEELNKREESIKQKESIINTALTKAYKYILNLPFIKEWKKKADKYDYLNEQFNLDGIIRNQGYKESTEEQSESDIETYIDEIDEQDKLNYLKGKIDLNELEDLITAYGYYEEIQKNKKDYNIEL